METLKAKLTYHLCPSVIGAKGFHYPDWENQADFTLSEDVVLKTLPFVCLENRSMVAFQISKEAAKLLGLTIPVIWISK